ncbi:MAG: methylenetetrahydrofolate reductase C-terminal domain-containing protein [Anaerolineales bacterium]
MSGIFYCPMECPKRLSDGPCCGSTPEFCDANKTRLCIWYKTCGPPFKIGRQRDWWQGGDQRRAPKSSEPASELERSLGTFGTEGASILSCIFRACAMDAWH